MSDNAYYLRVATWEDVAALRALIAASVRGLQTEYTEAQREGALGHVLGLDTQLIADGTYFVAEAGGAPVASGGWSYRATLFGSDNGPDRMPQTLDPARDAAKIRAIFVLPAWARRGLGTRLLRHCEAAARDAGFMRVEMGSTLTGVPLYQREGYVAMGRVEVPLPNGEHLVIVPMEKALLGCAAVRRPGS